MPSADLTATLQQLASERRYAPAFVARWRQLAPDDAWALVELAQELRLGEHQLRDLWEWAEDIAARDARALAAVLTEGPVGAARRRPLGRNDKLKAVKLALRRLRYPQLVAAEDRIAALVRQLGLPRTVQVTVPEYLEGDTLRIEIVARSATALAEAAAALQAAAQRAECAAIFALLEEAP